ncbi:unnamed protein product [Rhizophagus irregularis]|nr:unnamed protein product [Rhizophagus irregularis]
MSNGDIFERHRRITNPSFQSLPVHVFVESLMKLLDVMEKVDNEPTIEIKNFMHDSLTLNNLEGPKNVTTYNEVLKELGNPLYFVIPFLSYLPRPEALKKMTKLNNLYDGRVEKKRQSMKSGELDEKINNNSADLLEHMIQACNDPENPTLTSERITT